MVSTDCLQIIKFGESKYPIAIWDILFDNWSNSKNKSAKKTFSGSFLINLYTEEPTRIIHMLC